jgi:hypothetical protein
MTRDIVERLRVLAQLRDGAPLHKSSETEAVWLREAADEIERLREEIAAEHKRAERDDKAIDAYIREAAMEEYREGFREGRRSALGDEW